MLRFGIEKRSAKADLLFLGKGFLTEKNCDGHHLVIAVGNELFGIVKTVHRRRRYSARAYDLKDEGYLFFIYYLGFFLQHIGEDTCAFGGKSLSFYLVAGDARISLKGYGVVAVYSVKVEENTAFGIICPCLPFS